MNYRHAFHAGNFADVFKHALLIELLLALEAKPSALCYVDTHAGRGQYDLLGAQADRTREYVEGVQRILEARSLPPTLDRYAALVRSFGTDADGVLVRYPGSPAIASALLREQDRAIVCELHAEEAAALKSAMRNDSRVAVHERDGYAALHALLPPAQKRGLVLIDPPFEAQAGEFPRIQAALEQGIARWPNATYAVWYPIKQRESIAPFHRWLAQIPTGDVLVAELLLHPDNSGLRLNGCGIVLVNPPWQFDKAIATWLPELARLLAQSRYGSSRVDWLKTD